MSRQRNVPSERTEKTLQKKKKRTKYNGDKESARCRVQHPGYKDAQGELQQRDRKHKSGERKHKIETFQKQKMQLTKIKNTLEGINSRLDEAEDHISDHLLHKEVKIMQSEEK